MRPGKLSSSNESKLWRSPTPYLLGGTSGLMGLIAIALIVFACSNRGSTNTSSGDSTIQTNDPAAADVPPGQIECKLAVVIMPGDDKPSFLAKSSNSSKIVAPSESSGYLCQNCGSNQER